VYTFVMGKLVLLLCVAGLVLAAPAQAKGPDRATLTGPGLETPLRFSGYGTDGAAPLGLLTQEGGFWAQVFGGAAAGAGQAGLLDGRPRGALGPRYLIVYRLPGGGPKPSLIRQELYPYAAQPVSFMPRQRFWRTHTTPGGWYRLGSALKPALIEKGLPAQPDSCAVTTSALPSGRYGTGRLWVTLPAGGILHVQRNEPDDGLFGTKLGWTLDRDRDLTLSVSGRRLDAPGRMTVKGVFWGHSSTGKGGWASAVAFPSGGCWRITGRTGPTTLSFVVRVVPDSR
jgi:hypothetical protein